MELCGEYGAKIDEMSRLVLARPLRDAVDGSPLLLLRGGLPRLPCLWLYTEENWKRRKEAAVRNASLSVLERLNAKMEVEIDKQGRILIPPSMKRYAKLTKDCIVVGQDDRIVIWDEARYDEYLEDTGEGFTDEWNGLSVLQLKEKGFGDGRDNSYSGASGADSGVAGPEGSGESDV